MDNSQIKRLLLFISTVPEARQCKALMSYLYSRKFINELHGILQIIRLDTEEARNRARSGKYFSITVVPSLVVILENGVTKIYNGSDKISMFVELMLSPPPQPEILPPSTGKYVNMDSYESERKPLNRRKNTKIVVDDNLSEIDFNRQETSDFPFTNDDEENFLNNMEEIPQNEENISQDEIIEEEPVKKGKKTKKSTKTTKNAKKVTKKTKITVSTKIPKKSGMSDTMSKAAAMKAEFENKIESTKPKQPKDFEKIEEIDNFDNDFEGDFQEIE